MMQKQNFAARIYSNHFFFVVFVLFAKFLSSLLIYYKNVFIPVNYYLVAFFLLATVFLRPFRVRALFLVLCPLNGNPIR